MTVSQELLDQYFQWWQGVAGRYLNILQGTPSFLRTVGLSLERYLEFRRTFDRLLEEMWRTLRLPTFEEVIRLHERLNMIEMRLVNLEEQGPGLEPTVLLEDVKSLKSAIEQARDRLIAACETRVKEDPSPKSDSSG